MTDEPGKKHTPGPWIVFDCDEELEVIPAGRSGGIALITSQENRDANARLIAAAPMMLEALKQIEEENHRLRAEVAELKEDLLEYGGHRHSCHKYTYPLLEPKRCDCGWSEVVTRHA